METKILDMLKENYSLIEIMCELKISYKKLLECISNLIDYGYNFDKEIFSDGKILMRIRKEFMDLNSYKLNINFTNENSFRALFISDLHIGSEKDRIDTIVRACDYAIANKINFIFNLGDFIENVYTKEHLRIKTVEEQVSYIVKNFPIDRRLIFVSLYGNHDYHYVENGGIDVANEIEKKRPDIISLGYGRAYVRLGLDYICLEHECRNRPAEIYGLSEIKFIGHSHFYKYNEEHGKTIYVPSLSDRYPSNYRKKTITGFLDVTFLFNNEMLINKMIIEHFVDNYGLFAASKLTLKLSRTRNKINI